jgi:hypothetical protein
LDKSTKILLEKRADVNAKGGFKGNALQTASSRGHNQIFKQLFDKGAGFNVQGGDYRRDWCLRPYQKARLQELQAVI